MKTQAINRILACAFIWFLSSVLATADSGKDRGIGAAIDIDKGTVVLRNIIPGSPAEKAGLKKGDHITAIDGKSTRGVDIKHAIKRLTGPAGSTVTLVIEAANGDVRTVEVTRGFEFTPARSIGDFAGTFLVGGLEEYPTIIDVAEDGRCTVDFKLKYWKGFGVAYENPNHKTCQIKGVFQVSDHPKVQPEWRKLAGYFYLVQVSDGVLKLTTVWSLGTMQGKEEYFLAKKND